MDPAIRGAVESLRMLEGGLGWLSRCVEVLCKVRRVHEDSVRVKGLGFRAM